MLALGTHFAVGESGDVRQCRLSLPHYGPSTSYFACNDSMYLLRL
jgi:hypothetical protein